MTTVFPKNNNKKKPERNLTENSIMKIKGLDLDDCLSLHPAYPPRVRMLTEFYVGSYSKCY